MKIESNGYNSSGDEIFILTKRLYDNTKWHATIVKNKLYFGEITIKVINLGSYINFLKEINYKIKNMSID
ncbi:MAG: hypothetical protein GF329_07790 [Candidatus Lokiarchaeota archaeon]|nr:hypothetical protein [Candidatus Lokiarchaeota archaeon]